MTGRRSYDMGIEDLENRLRGLPRRESSEGLRRRVLAAGVPARRPFLRARPALATVALVALLALDLLVVTVQDHQLDRIIPALPAEMVAAAPAPDADLAWLRDLGLPEQSVAIVALTRQTATRDTYFSLRESLLTNGSGG